MADVHGRPFSSAEGDEKRRKTEALDDSEDKDSSSPHQKSRIESGNPLSSKNGNTISSSAKTLGEKKPSGRMIKKKSLKRL